VTIVIYACRRIEFGQMLISGRCLVQRPDPMFSRANLPIGRPKRIFTPLQLAELEPGDG